VYKSRQQDGKTIPWQKKSKKVKKQPTYRKTKVAAG
jgi:hypothetical protein